MLYSELVILLASTHSFPHFLPPVGKIYFFSSKSNFKKLLHVQEFFTSVDTPPQHHKQQQKKQLKNPHPNPIFHYKNLLASHKEFKY